MALEPFHILAEPVVRERFEYKAAGLQVAFVRIFRLQPSWILEDLPAYGGCRSWVSLPELPANTRFEPVLSNEQHEERARGLSTLLARPAQI